MGSKEKVVKRRYTHEDKSLVILKSTLSRLPIYFCYLQEKLNQGVEYISSSRIADDLALNPVQVRKDLASVSSVPGKPKRGFLTERLLSDMKSFLGYSKDHEALIVGVGRLGSTLLQYKGFENYGLNIAAGFDISPDVIGKKISGKTIQSMDKFASYLKRNHLRVGIIAVPATEAQSVANLMIANGIRAIWNFAPSHVSVPRGVIIKNENLAASLAILSNEFSKNLAAGKVLPL